VVVPVVVPVVVKVLGRYGGIGVMLAESTASLRSLVDFAIAQGHNPLLCEIAEDFRSGGSKDPEIFRAIPLSMAIETAVRAAAACRVAFAGVDLLEDPAGKVWFLEANFPFYYPHAQLYCGVDIAGKMVDFLAAKARGSG